MSSTKENNKNASNAQGTQGNNIFKYNKKFLGGNAQLQGKIFEITAKDAVHQFAETIKAVADYVGQEYTHGGDIRFLIENFDDYNFIRPPDPPQGADQYEVES
jgi:hypothetical protein